jgi:uncharacterized protein DUF6152
MLKAMLLVAVAGLLFPVMPASAHHAFAAEFDAKKGIKVSGTITKLEWSNPHAWLYVDVKDESGKVTNWSFELGSPNGLIREGWRRTSLKEGDRVTIEGFLAKDGSNTANAHSVTLPDGRKVFAGSEGPNAGAAK